MTDAHGFFANVNASRGYICFFGGILLAFFCSYADKMPQDRRRKMLAICIAELAIMVFFMLTPYYDYYAIKDYNLFASFMFFPELIFVCYNLKGVNRLCNCKLVQYAGKISFDIYVWNFPILITYFAVDHLGNLWWNVQAKGYWSALVIVHIVVGILSYEIVEKKMPSQIRDFFDIKK